MTAPRVGMLERLWSPPAVWAEGPVWVPDGGDGCLLFSDLISNVIYRWAPGEPLAVHLDRAGYSGI